MQNLQPSGGLTGDGIVPSRMILSLSAEPGSVVGIEDSSAIVFVHLDKPKAKAVIVSVPKNFDRNKLKYDYFTVNDCKFILKAWY